MKSLSLLEPVEGVEEVIMPLKQCLICLMRKSTESWVLGGQRGLAPHLAHNGSARCIYCKF